MKKLITILLLCRACYGQGWERPIVRDSLGNCYDSILLIMTTYPETFEWRLFECACPLVEIDTVNAIIIKWKPKIRKNGQARANKSN